MRQRLFGCGCIFGVKNRGTTTLSMIAKMVWGYVAIGVLTLIFEFYIRLPICTAANNCGSSLIKGLYLSVGWPLGWIVYLRGLF
jgi:hypothetical protein